VFTGAIGTIIISSIGKLALATTGCSLVRCRWRAKVILTGNFVAAIIILEKLIKKKFH
jgi:hypothetical protein